MDFDSSLDSSEPDEYWRRYVYFNAGFFFYSFPHAFGAKFLEYALAVRNEPMPELACQELTPWLDQIVLPLVVHALGGGRDTLEAGYLDGNTSHHYGMFPLLYTRESQQVIETLKTVAAPNKLIILKDYEAIKRTVYQGHSEKVRALFDQNHMPRREQAIRNRIKSEGFWMR